MYSYDGSGNRIRKQIVNSNTGAAVSDIYYVNGADGKTQAVAWSPSGSNYTYNVFGNDMIGQIRMNGTTANRFYYLKDHLGTIRMTVNTVANVVSYDDYYPYGMVMPTRSSASSSEDARYKFTSKERDAETTYDYFGARYYDSRIGRWLSVDPMAWKYPSWSPYNYCMNNPLRLVDPNGAEIYIYGSDPQNPVKYIGKKTKYNKKDKFLDAIITALNNMYDTDAGKVVLDILMEANAHYDYYEGGKDKDFAGYYEPSGDGDRAARGGQLHFNKKDFGTIAHESFHAYVQEMNEGGLSLWAETQAKAFEYLIQGKTETGLRSKENEEKYSPRGWFISDFETYLQNPTSLNLSQAYTRFKDGPFYSKKAYGKAVESYDYQVTDFNQKLFGKKK